MDGTASGNRAIGTERSYVVVDCLLSCFLFVTFNFHISSTGCQQDPRSTAVLRRSQAGALSRMLPGQFAGFR